VEDVRAILVYEYSVPIEVVVRVSSDVVAAVDDQHALAGLAGEPLGHDAAGKAGADDEHVEVGSLEASHVSHL
jgi:hypothetical protein